MKDNIAGKLVSMVLLKYNVTSVVPAAAVASVIQMSEATAAVTSGRTISIFQLPPMNALAKHPSVALPPRTRKLIPLYCWFACATVYSTTKAESFNQNTFDCVKTPRLAKSTEAKVTEGIAEVDIALLKWKIACTVFPISEEEIIGSENVTLTM